MLLTVPPSPASLGCFPSRRRDRDPAFERAIGRQTARSSNSCARFFSAGPSGLCIAKQNNRASPSSASLRPCAALRVQVRPVRRLSPPEVPEGRGQTDDGAYPEERYRPLRAPSRLISYRPRADRTPPLRPLPRPALLHTQLPARTSPPRPPPPC